MSDHFAIWVSNDGWNLNCACGWKSEKVGYYQRDRALAEHDAHVTEAERAANWRCRLGIHRWKETSAETVDHWDTLVHVRCERCGVTTTRMHYLYDERAW